MNDFNTRWAMQMIRMYEDDPKQRRDIYFQIAVLMGDIAISGDVSSIERMFNEINISLLKPHFAMGLLRNTFAYQQHIKNWEVFRQAVIEYYEEHGPSDWKDTFSGLLSPPKKLSEEEKAMRNALHRMMKVHPSLHAT